MTIEETAAALDVSPGHDQARVVRGQGVALPRAPIAMTIRPDDWALIKAIVAGALERPERDRQAYIADRLRRQRARCSRRSKACLRHTSKPTHSSKCRAHWPAGGRCGPDLTGATVGSYTIVSRLGAGGMGEVYLARDAKLDRARSR